jgi:hypothetical protein
VEFLRMPIVMSNNCRKILLENIICKPLLQAVIASEMPTMLLFTHTAYIAAIDIFYTLDSASNYSAIKKLKP